MASCDYKLFVQGMREGELSQRLLPLDVVEDNLKKFALQVSDQNDPFQVLATLPPDQKKILFNNIYKLSPRSLRPKYRGCIFEVSNYEIGFECGNIRRLQQEKRSKFCIDIDINNDKLHIEDQYLKLVFKAPSIDSTKFNPESIPDYDPDKIRFRYCNKPGIRLIPEYTLKCDSSEVQKIYREQLMTMDKNLIQEQVRPLWNYLIGEDNGVDTELVLPDTNAVQVTKMKYGYQTPKIEQEELVIYIPLQLYYNINRQSRLNTGMLREGTLSIVGDFERSDLMVRCDYYGNRFDEEPIRIPCNPLEIKEMKLVSNYVRVGDYLHALDLYSISSKLVEIVDVNKYTCDDLDKCIKLKGTGVLESMLVYIRPNTYEEDFYLWDQFSEVEEFCTQLPAIIEDPDGELSQCGVGTTKHYKVINNVEKIGLKWGDEDLKPVKPVVVYEGLAKYRLSRNTDLFNPTGPVENGLYMLLFNDLYLTRQLSCLLNMSSLHEPILEIKFKDELVGLENHLDKKYEIVVLSYMLNTVSSYGRTLGLNYIY